MHKIHSVAKEASKGIHEVREETDKNSVDHQTRSCMARIEKKQEWKRERTDIEDRVVPLERKLYGHLSSGLLWKWQIEEVLLRT